MKKFLAIAVAFLAIMIATPAYTAEAADVPDFRSIAGRQVKFTNNVRWSRDSLGSQRHYNYRCSVDLDEHFAEQWVNLVMRSGLFKLIAHDKGDLPNSSLEKWYFVYVGPKKNVPTFNTVEQDYYKVHLSLWKSEEYNYGYIEFSIHVAPRLTYGGDDWADR